MKRILTLALSLALILTLVPGEANAAAKKPALVKEIYTSTKSKTATAVTLKWTKAKYAKQYQIFVWKKGWYKFKLVKKTAANKKKYTVKNKFKVAVKGKKYQVYKYRGNWILKTTVKAVNKKFNSKTITGLKKGTYYSFKVRGKNGKMVGAFSASIKIKTYGTASTITTEEQGRVQAESENPNQGSGSSGGTQTPSTPGKAVFNASTFKNFKLIGSPDISLVDDGTGVNTLFFSSTKDEYKAGTITYKKILDRGQFIYKKGTIFLVKSNHSNVAAQSSQFFVTGTTKVSKEGKGNADKYSILQRDSNQIEIGMKAGNKVWSWGGSQVFSLVTKDNLGKLYSGLKTMIQGKESGDQSKIFNDELVNVLQSIEGVEPYGVKDGVKKWNDFGYDLDKIAPRSGESQSAWLNRLSLTKLNIKNN